MSLRKPKLAIALGLALCVACGGAGIAVYDYLGDSEAHVTYAFSLDTPEEAAGWANDVFVGTVTEELGEQDREIPGGEGIPYTVYRVQVVDQLKGKAAGAIRVATLNVDSDDSVGPPVEVGKTYMFPTRLSVRSGWHNLPSNLVLTPLPSTQDPLIARWRLAVANAVLPRGALPPVLPQPGAALDQAYNQAVSR